MIQHCIGLGAQGIIVWDIEGEKGPLVFYGDPRIAATVSPEMNAAGVNVGGTGDILDRSTYPQGFDLVEVANSPSDLNDMTICAKGNANLLIA